MKKIWICGASGMLGSHFKRLLTERQISFVANDSQEVDITDLDRVSDFVRVQKVSHIVNCAAYTQVDKAEAEQKQAYLINAIGPHNLGVAARRHGARVLHFSTDYVFDGKGRTPYSEDHYCTPISAYGMSKLAGEMKLLDEHDHSCIIRTSWLFGIPGKNFVETMLRLMNEKEQLRIVYDQVGRPTYCQDLAEVALELLDEEGVFHFANAFETSWFQFAKEIHRQAKELGFPIKTKMIEPIHTDEYPTVAKRPAYSALNTKKIEGYLGKHPRPWQEALYDYLVHLKNYQKHCINVVEQRVSLNKDIEQEALMQDQRKVQNILVTGGAGFIGSAFIRYLFSPQVAFQGTCVNLDALTYAGNLDNLQCIANDPRYIFERGDIRQQSLVEHLCQEHAIDTIIHFAAESHVDRSILGPQTFIETNILGTFHLLEVVRKNPHIHFHHVSTDEVYGSLDATGYFTEESPYRPNSPYSASKASSDHLVRAYQHTYPLSTCISNCSNNYGPYHFPEKLIPVMILNCLERKPLPIYGEGINVRDWLYVEDHAQALYLLLKKGIKGETYNIGGEAEWRNIDLVQEIIRLISELQEVPIQELQGLITFVKDRPGHDLRYAIDCSKMKRELGWKPSCTFPEGLKQTILWYINNQEWVQNVRTGAYRQWMELNYSGR